MCMIIGWRGTTYFFGLLHVSLSGRMHCDNFQGILQAASGKEFVIRMNAVGVR